MGCFTPGNTTLWILIALLVLGNGNIFDYNILNGCGLPIILALLYCLYKNGTLANVFTPQNNCGCCD